MKARDFLIYPLKLAKRLYRKIKLEIEEIRNPISNRYAQLYNSYKEIGLSDNRKI